MLARHSDSAERIYREFCHAPERTSLVVRVNMGRAGVSSAIPASDCNRLGDRGDDQEKRAESKVKGEKAKRQDQEAKRKREVMLM